MIIKKISETTGLQRNYISKVIRSASHRYKEFNINKRSEGLRHISQPAKELKFLQRWVVENIFEKFPIHEKVFSYRKGLGIKNIADRHRKYNYLLKIDFKDFFPSITNKDIQWLLIQNQRFIDIELTIDDFDRICSIVCKNGRLTIGSPSSPIISNIILYSFDSYWDEYCKKQSIEYSRYADDIYFSTDTPNILTKIPKKIESYLRELTHPTLTINEKKTVFTSRKHSKLVTGITITSDKKLSIGRNKKRYIKSLVHKHSIGKLSKEKTAYLRGYISFAKSIDPQFIVSLIRKYGKDEIDSIFKEKLISLK